jgi:hypothetical protein
VNKLLARLLVLVVMISSARGGLGAQQSLPALEQSPPLATAQVPASIISGLATAAEIIPKVWNAVFPDRNKRVREVDPGSLQKTVEDSLKARIRPYRVEVGNLRVLRKAFDVGRKMEQRASKLVALCEMESVDRYNEAARGALSGRIRIEWTVLQGFQEAAGKLTAEQTDAQVRQDLARILDRVDDAMRELVAIVKEDAIIADLSKIKDRVVDLEKALGELEGLLSVRMQLYAEAIDATPN